MQKLPDWWNSNKPYRIMDCLEGMREIPDNSVDLILTDPPYGIGESNEKNLSRGNLVKPCIDYGCYNWDKTRIPKEYFIEIIRISKNQIIFGGNYYTDYLFPSSCWIIWDKKNGTNDFADCELAWTSFTSAVRIFHFKWNGMLQENMKKKEKRVYPTQKPIELFKWCLSHYSKPNDIILDPFLGSGTTLRACKETDRVGLGFEINPKSEETIRKRALLDIKTLEEFM